MKINRFKLRLDLPRHYLPTVLLVPALLLWLGAASAYGEMVIDGQAIATVTDPQAKQPRWIAVNPVTNKIYVANAWSSNVTVINGSDNSFTTVTNPKGLGVEGIAANPVSNLVYVINCTTDNVTVIGRDIILPF